MPPPFCCEIDLLLLNFIFDNFSKILFIFLISVGDKSILMLLPIFFFLFNALLTPCDTKVDVVATPIAGKIFSAIGFK